MLLPTQTVVLRKRKQLRNCILASHRYRFISFGAAPEVYKLKFDTFVTLIQMEQSQQLFITESMTMCFLNLHRQQKKYLVTKVFAIGSIGRQWYYPCTTYVFISGSRYLFIPTQFDENKQFQGSKPHFHTTSVDRMSQFCLPVKISRYEYTEYVGRQKKYRDHCL